MNERHKGFVLQNDRLGRVHHRELSFLIKVEEHRAERLVLIRPLINQNLHRMQPIKRFRIYIIRQRNALRIDFHIIKRVEPDIRLRMSFLHEPLQKEGRREILGIIVKTGKNEGRVLVCITDTALPHMREKDAQLRHGARIRIAFLEILRRNGVRIVALDDETGRVRVDLHHADAPRLVEHIVKPREPRRQPEHIRRAQIGQQLLGHVHRARKVVGRIAEHRRRFAKHMKKPP